MKLTDEMIKSIEDNIVFFISTCSKENVPNLIAVSCLKWIGNNKILIADNFMKKTLQNLKENPVVSFTVKEIRDCPYQFKGDVKVITEGEYLIEAGKICTKYKPKSAIVITIKEVYSLNSKDRPGELILK